jgi:phosphoglycolate phosphatase
LFDLDGTLIDTAADLVAVLNRLLRDAGRPPMPYAVARNRVSNGAVGLLRLGFGADVSADRLETLRRRFLEIYIDSVCLKSHLFIDIRDLFDPSSRISRWGIVTNKPHEMTVALLRSLGLERLPGCIVGGDSLPQRKPHPAPLLFAAETLGAAAADCIYVGDAERDIEAGRAAGMRTAVAAYGYIPPAVDPATWGADAVIRHPRELAATLRALGAALP